MHTDSLVNEYVHVVNQALGRNRDRFPFKQLVKTAGAVLDGKDIRMEVYSSDSDAPHDHFQVAFRGEKLELKGQGKEPADIVWKVPRAHLEEAVDDPDRFAKNPEQLNLDWLKQRLG